MKKKIIHPYIKYGLIYSIKDTTKPSKVSAFSIGVSDKVEQKQLLFDFEYEPILDLSEYKNLVTFFGAKKHLFSKLYKSMSGVYFNLYAECIKWYHENNATKKTFILKEQINRYENKVVETNCCPIINYLDFSELNNLNFINNTKACIYYSELNNIKSINMLLYNTNDVKDFLTNMNPTKHGKQILNSVTNIVYIRFLHFLKSNQNISVKGIPKLNVKQIALIHIYKRQTITKENASEKAAKYGYNSKTSGDGLFQDYTKYCNHNNRVTIDPPSTPLKLKNRISLLESIMTYLTEEEKKSVQNDINSIKLDSKK